MIKELELSVEKRQETRLSYSQAFELMKEMVDKKLRSSPLLVREYMRHLALSTGKFIRATSVLACALDSEDLIHRDTVKLAAAIELLHLATLVHDDVIDDAETRRGMLSLQKKFGKRTAVICGDYLLCMAMKTAASVEGKEDYIKLTVPDYVSRVCLGELNQHIHNGDFELSAYQYLKIIAGKTAALFEACFHGGAILAGCDEAAVRKFVRLGRYIGMIFQLTDDCMDYESTQQEAKKPVQADFGQNVITLPLIHAFRELDGLKDRAKSGNVSPEEINEAVRKSGGLSYTRLVAKRYYNKAMSIIDELELTRFKREMLLKLLSKSYRII
jgi:heptaprenyl diphosphate synthase